MHAMKLSHMNPKAKGGSRTVLSAQQAAFELKHKVVLSLNKLTDRDTHQIGVEELEKIAESLTPDGLAPFLSCITDTDSDQKSSVRKECVRIMGTLARIHGGLLGSHLNKMVCSIVKRLKDSDSVVRDACVDTAGILSANIRIFSGRDGSEAAFVALARPLFEALGEQNRYVQAGSAFCLARVIDEAGDPPLQLLTQMLSRLIKLLRNQNFMAKPAVIELIRSIIQAGGATTESTQSAAMNAVLDALKNNDWMTRKTASVALAGIAVSAGSSMGSFRMSCIRSLERCRFDKVKPVRDAIVNAIQHWNALPGTNSPEPSETGSSTKENYTGDYRDVTNASDGGWREPSFRKACSVSVLSVKSATSTKKRMPLTIRKACPNYGQNQQHIKSSNWHIEMSLPKSHTIPSIDSPPKESEGSCISKEFGRTPYTREQDMSYDYDPVDDKPECSSMSDVVSGNFETKHVTGAHGCLEECDSSNLVGINHISAMVETEGLGSQDQKSLESTVTDLCSSTRHGCCLHAASELGIIRKQLVEIEAKQSDLLNLLQVFMGNSMNSMSTLQSKVHNLEHAVDKIVLGTTQSDFYPSITNSKVFKKSQSNSSSPRLSSSTPRSSADANNRQASLLSTKNREMWEESASRKSRSSTSERGSVDISMDPVIDRVRNPIAKIVQKSSGSSHVVEPNSMISLTAYKRNSKHSYVEGKSGTWKRVKELLCLGDMESAYGEALFCGNDRALFELMDRTGPVLEKLSAETADGILCTLATHLVNQRFLDFIIPWLQQMVELSNACEPRQFVQSTKTRMAFLLAIKQAAAMEYSDPVERISIAQLAGKLSQLWGEASCRKMPPSMGSQRSKDIGSYRRE